MSFNDILMFILETFNVCAGTKSEVSEGGEDAEGLHAAAIQNSSPHLLSAQRTTEGAKSTH